MLSEEKFFSKAKKFALYPTVDDKFFTFDELVEKLKMLKLTKMEITSFYMPPIKMRNTVILKMQKPKAMKYCC